jgi:hypothetical protein
MYPAQVMFDLVQAGRSFDQGRSLHTTVAAGLASIPADMERIGSTIEDIATRYIPDFVTAASDEAFQAVMERFIADVMAAGYQTYVDWYRAEWNLVAEFVRSIT